MKRSILVTTTAIGILTGPLVVQSRAEMQPSLNFSGVPGLIDMPSGEAQADGRFSVSASIFGNMRRSSMTFQLAPRISASYRFQKIDGYTDVVPSGQDPYTDRSFDLRFLLVRETDRLPSVTVGLQDFIGTGISSAEYVAATKTFGGKIKVTAGLGWGRLGSYGSIGSPFGDRPSVDFGLGGKPTAENWFRGPAAPFAGIEWKVNDKWTVKAEYSSDGYDDIAGNRKVFDRNSPFNFGVEYSLDQYVRAGVYSLYGSEIGLSFQMVLDPKNRLAGGVAMAAPVSVGQRPSRGADPDAYDGGWVTQPDAGTVLKKNLAKRLAVDGIKIESLTYTANTVELRIRNTKLDAGPQAIGRAARALSHVMPASVEVFEIVPVVNGIGASRVTVRRADLEALEHVAANHDALRSRVTFADAGSRPVGGTGEDGLYPKFTWGVTPTVRFSGALEGKIGLRFSAGYELRPGLILSGSIYKGLIDNLDDTAEVYSSALPPVRIRNNQYNLKADPGLERLTLAWYAHPVENIYSRVTFGYLERMHAGLSAEVLWKPVESRLAFGVEVNHTAQRDTDGGFGFDEFDYNVTTGHVSAYYDFGKGYLGQVDVGRYLAGDVGATVALDREFANGWRVGAFATLTDVTAEDFGEGSFDKGIRLTIPMNWLLGRPTRAELNRTLRPILRDGGARLDVNGRLYESLREYQGDGMDADWGRVWQ